MAISSAASGDPGKAAPPRLDGAAAEPGVSDTGMEMEAALPAVIPLNADPTKPILPPAAAAVATPEFKSTITADHLKNETAAVVRELEDKFARLLEEVHENRPGDDLDIIRRAWVFCLQQHEGQKRASGEPYVIHPLEVAQVLAELKMDSTAIAAGLLHDAVEDTDVTTAEIETQFGEQVAHIVEGVTKLDKIKFANREDHQAENIRKMLLAMVTDVRVVIIKLADRLHNMRTLEHLKPEKQQKIARETLDIYAPLAHRLGMGKLRGELEDLAFRYTDPFTYEQLTSEVDRCAGRARSFLQRDREGRSKRSCRSTTSQARVESRIKRLYSIQQKLQTQKIPVDQVYDLLAIRVICQNGAGLLCGAGAAAQHVAAGAGAHQGLHRDAAAEPVPVAAYDADRAGRAPVRGADPHGGHAPRGGGRHCGALEVQGRRQRYGEG